MSFEFTNGQKVALEMVTAFMKARPPMPAVLTGFAGTGKTTMIKAFASQYGEPIVLAPTGKAAVRVQEATGLKASTIHRWLYVPKEDPETGEVKYRLKDWNQIEIPYNRLVIVDEASMVGREVWEHIWDRCQTNELRVLLVGDTFQLAPVEVNRGRDEQYVPFNILADVETEYRAHLSEVTRQALDNPILKASMLLRESSRIDQALGLLPRVFGKNFNDKCMDVYQQGGAIIVHKNDTRHRLNAMVRERLGYGPEIRVGEPLLVLRNTYEIDRFNGEVIKFDGWSKYDQMPKATRDRWRNISLMLTFGLAKVDGGKEVMLSPEQIRGEAAAMTESVIGRTSKTYYCDNYHDPDKPLYSEDVGGSGSEYLGPPHLHTNFGYALTCHKSQGSEWAQVLVLIENSVRAASYEGRRWVYTAVTRSKEQCYISMEV